jgi:hypothetical protein
LENLAEALAQESNTKQLKRLTQLRERETQQSVARKIRYLRGKGSLGSTTLVMEEKENGRVIEYTNKKDIEQAILSCNQAKFQQSHHRPFYQFTLAQEFRFKGTTMAANAVLAGVYETPHHIPQSEREFLQALQMPEKVKELNDNMHLSTETYTRFWNKAKERTSTYPDALLFSTMKAGSKTPSIAEAECMITRIPLKAGYAPKRWKNCMDVMILKRSGVTWWFCFQQIVIMHLNT